MVDDCDGEANRSGGDDQRVAGAPAPDAQTTSPERAEAQLEIFRRFGSLAVAMGAAVHDCEARVTGDGRVVLLFAHHDFPAVRFGYRCKPPGQARLEELWLSEEIATGALHRMMRYDRPVVSAGRGVDPTARLGSRRRRRLRERGACLASLRPRRGDQ